MDPSASNSGSGAETRRTFLKKGFTAAAVLAAGGAAARAPLYGQAPSPGSVLGANDRLTVGFIGVGGQGMAHVRTAFDTAADQNVKLAAMCDLWPKRIDTALAHAGLPASEGHLDYRRILDRKDIDAVFIATVDHWHARIAIEAMEAGKHVYVEKPITRYLGEAFAVHDTTKKTGRILQVGSQFCSEPRWHQAAQLVRDGRIGPLVLAQGSYMRNNGTAGGWNYRIDPDLTPEAMNWSEWLGPVSKRPFSADHYFRWRKYLPYCGGLLSDLLPHRLHPLMLATGNPEFPTRVVSLGTRRISTDRDVSDNTQLLAEFPSGLTIMATSSTVNEQGLPDMIRGHHATLQFGGDRLELRPERPFSDEVDPETFGPYPPMRLVTHHHDWFAAIRANRPPSGNIDLAIRVQTVLSLAETSERQNVMCLFDEKTRKVTTADGRPVDLFTYDNEPQPFA